MTTDAPQHRFGVPSTSSAAATATPAETNSPPRPDTPGTRPISVLASVRDYSIVLFLVLLFLALALTNENFLTIGNLRNVVDGAVATGLVAAAGTIVIIAGGFDLSAGAIFSVAGVVGVLMSNSAGPVLGVLSALGVGCVLGLTNGLLTTVGRITHFVATVGTMVAFTGLAVALSGSGLLLVNDPSLASLANTRVLGFNVSTWILVAAALMCGFLLNCTVFGRHVFGAGGNLSAARLSGVPIQRTLIACYALSGFMAAAASIIVVSRSLSTTANSGNSIIFDALAAVLIGGNSVAGGEGAIWRTMVGVGILALISNGFSLFGIDPIYQQVVSGIIILVAVSADAWSRRRRA